MASLLEENDLGSQCALKAVGDPLVDPGRIPPTAHPRRKALGNRQPSIRLQMGALEAEFHSTRRGRRMRCSVGAAVAVVCEDMRVTLNAQWR